MSSGGGEGTAGKKRKHDAAPESVLTEAEYRARVRALCANLSRDVLLDILADL
jgi:hypothetical protein